MFMFLCFLVFLILWCYFLYPVYLVVLNKFKVNRNEPIDENYAPSVSIVIVAHNEEKVIEKTILSCLKQNYCRAQLEIVVASDHSTDATIEIAKKYKDSGVRIVQTKDRKGRANAHNEACETITSDVIAFCDANTIWEEDTVENLVTSLAYSNVGYVSGKLSYINPDDNHVSHSEGLYWRYELMLRKLESSSSSITAGNGAVYAIKRNCYEAIDPLYSHDIVLPSMVVKKGLRSVYNPDALAYERAGETTSDEYARKVRMFGRAWHFMYKNMDVFNPFKVGISYSIFMISHRFLRYSAGLLQAMILFLSILILLLGYDGSSVIFNIFMLAQVLFYVLVLLGKTMILGSKGYQLYYFNLFHLATLVGLFNALTNKIKPFWLSPQSTRK
jgi:cellulose synthase/poly-beta-1,6-N-acetylglucosamine synthase-like glycosyltransferase